MPKTAKKTFLILDGHALLHRAWHALPPLTTKDGLVVHGAYGFTTIMLGAIRQFAPDYMAVTFDLKGPTFRHKQYEDYKATREKKPDELYAQVDVIRKILDAMGIAVFTAEGFEADDVIGTLSKRAAELSPDVDTIIVTGDLDTLQLVDSRTKVYTLRKGMSDTVTYDEKAVKERYGLKPTQLIDYKALRGDPSDNIPGVKGIGEKTGSELIGEFGSIEKLYASLDKDDKRAKALKPSVREKLLTHRDDAFAALDLCRIRRDVPVDFDLRGATFRAPTREQMTPVFTELEFMKLLKQFPEGTPSTPARPTEATASLFGDAPSAQAATDATEIRDVKALATALAALGKFRRIAFRTVNEDGRVKPKIVALGLAEAKRTYVVSGSALRDGKPLLAKFFAEDREKICHDVKREIAALSALGLPTGGPFIDLMLASYLLHSGERRHALGAILAYERGVPLDEEKDADAASRTAKLSSELPHFVPLAETFTTELAAQKLDALMRDIELPLASTLARMEARGVAIDAAYFATLSKELTKEVEKLVKKIHEAAGGEFNINSPAQLKEVLFDKLGISSEGMKKTAKGKTLSTAASELEKLKGSHPVIEDILRYRELAKLLSTYVDAIPALADPSDGRVHAEFNQTVAATGRLSSSNPNLQNIPTPETDYGKRVRNGFVAGKGKVLIAMDYSQIELRIAAHIAKEKLMTKAFRDGEDIHWRTAVEMFGEKDAAAKRRIAKVINFGILYGMGPNRLAEAADISFAEARDYIAQYFAIHAGIAKYMERIKEQVERDGYVETLFGRKRFFRNVKFMNPRERAEAERQAINMPIQGTNADMIKLAMVRLDRHVAEAYGDTEAAPRMIIQVHDELVFEVGKGDVEKFSAEAREIMENVQKLDVPVVVNVSTGTRWGEMTKIA